MKIDVEQKNCPSLHRSLLIIFCFFLKYSSYLNFFKLYLVVNLLLGFKANNKAKSTLWYICTIIINKKYFVVGWFGTHTLPRVYFLDVRLFNNFTTNIYFHGVFCVNLLEEICIVLRLSTLSIYQLFIGIVVDFETRNRASKHKVHKEIYCFRLNQLTSRKMFVFKCY